MRYYDYTRLALQYAWLIVEAKPHLRPQPHRHPHSPSPPPALPLTATRIPPHRHDAGMRL